MGGTNNGASGAIGGIGGGGGGGAWGNVSPGGNGGNGYSGVIFGTDIRAGGGGGGTGSGLFQSGTGGAVGGGGGGGNAFSNMPGALGAYGGIRITITYGSGPVPCYNKGTKILCVNNEGNDDYKPIEDITIGTIVKTYQHGYRRVEIIVSDSLINDVTDPFKCMYRMRRRDNMLDDLIVTGGHSILVNAPPRSTSEINKQRKYWGNKIYKLDSKYLCMASVSDLFAPIDDTNKYTYYHLMLEDDGDSQRHYGIWANGVLTESISHENCCECKYQLY
jgi:hypothetical protein